YGASTPTWCAGSDGNINGSGQPRRPWPVGNASTANNRASSPTGQRWPTTGDQNDKSRVTGDCHARSLWEPGAATPPATRRDRAGRRAGEAGGECIETTRRP